jgi:hypothetical protein
MKPSMEGLMRLALPILLLMTGTALAQPQPASSDKPYVDDSMISLCSFSPPTPVTVGSGSSNTRAPTPPSNPTADCRKPEAPKTPARGVG